MLSAMNSSDWLKPVFIQLHPPFVIRLSEGRLRGEEFMPGLCKANLEIPTE